jgi:glutamate synthase (ferredoxin)
MWLMIGLVVVVLLAGLVVWDLTQKRHAILRNFPIIGHFRYLLEAVGPELRQYIVTSNDEERPFSRDQRTWVYTSAKRVNNYFGFGSDNDMETKPNYLVIHHSPFPLDDPHPGDSGWDPEHRLPCAKVIGAARERAKAFRPASVVNISGMSFGSLSHAAIEALNRGAAIAGCWHNTGEGGVSPWHQSGGDLVWQLGTGYFGARTPDGNLDLDRLVEVVAAIPSIRAIEIKLSQGAKPGLGGVLPAAKVTPIIAEIRGVELGRSCLSPARHRAFRDVDEMLDLVEAIAGRTGLPVGIKSAVSGERFWLELAASMEDGSRGVDFIAIDGGEGGTGAAPLVFSDHVALPFKLAFSRVYRIFAERGLSDRVVFQGSGKLGFPEQAALAMALGCDLIAVAREAMLAIGCIQAQRCHTGHCPTGVATHNRWLVRGLDPTDKAARLANYVVTLRAELLRIARAGGVAHPGDLRPDQFEILDGTFGARTAAEVFGVARA